MNISVNQATKLLLRNVHDSHITRDYLKSIENNVKVKTIKFDAGWENHGVAREFEQKVVKCKDLEDLMCGKLDMDSIFEKNEKFLCCFLLMDLASAFIRSTSNRRWKQVHSHLLLAAGVSDSCCCC